MRKSPILALLAAGALMCAALIALATPAVAGTTSQLPGTYVPLSPVRILDTRASDGPGIIHTGTLADGDAVPVARFDNGQVMDLQVADVNNDQVPVGASAVVLNVTAVGASACGYVEVYPGGSSAPGTSNLNFDIGETVPNLVEVKMGVGGDVDLTTSICRNGTVDIVVDVEGYYVGGTATAAGTFQPVVPYRALDTRIGKGVAGSGAAIKAAPVSAGQPLDVQVTGQEGVPSDADAVVLNVTVVGPGSGGYVVVYPGGASSVPTASNVNFMPGETLPNLVTVAVGANGDVDIRPTFMSSTASVNLVVDVFGYYLPGQATAQGAYVSLSSPSRLFDTRQTRAVSGAAPLDEQVAGVDGVAESASAVVMNVTETDSSTFGDLTVYPGDLSSPPVASNLNFPQGVIIANETITRLGSEDGDIKIALSPSGQTSDVIGDVAGYFIGPPVTVPTVTGLSASLVSGAWNRVSLSWTNPSGVTGVVLCRSTSSSAMTPACTGGTPVAVPTGASRFTDSGLIASTPYYYTIFASEGRGRSVGTQASVTTGAAPTDSQLTNTDPTENGLGQCSQTGIDTSTACVNGALADFDTARAKEGLGPMVLPSNWSSLDAAQETIVLANIDRMDRGLSPFAGLNSTLDSSSAAAVSGSTGGDPDFPPGSFYGGSNWAGTGDGQINPLWAEYMWVYDDGWGGSDDTSNVDCTSAAASGCWGHRDNILNADYASGAGTVMGAAEGPGGLASLYIGDQQTLTYTADVWHWASEASSFAAGSPENPSG